MIVSINLQVILLLQKNVYKLFFSMYKSINKLLVHKLSMAHRYIESKIPKDRLGSCTFCRLCGIICGAICIDTFFMVGS